VGRYSPTWVEYGIVIGLIAVFAAVVTFGYQRLRLGAPTTTGESA
jgi:Ni/Fe-hydrogenase subunit HybB-like protein